MGTSDVVGGGVDGTDVDGAAVDGLVIGAVVELGVTVAVTEGAVLVAVVPLVPRSVVVGGEEVSDDEGDDGEAITRSSGTEDGRPAIATPASKLIAARHTINSIRFIGRSR